MHTYFFIIVSSCDARPTPILPPTPTLTQSPANGPPALESANAVGPSQGGTIYLEELAHIEDHGEFIQQLINAKAFADLNGVSVPITWRGKSSLVEPNLPPFTKMDYIDRVTSAIPFVSAQKVIICYTPLI